MAAFRASIPARPADAPGDAYPGADSSDWNRYLRRITDEREHRGSFAVRRGKITTETIILVTGGDRPTEWDPVGRTDTTVAGVKADYTTYERKYPSLTLQEFIKVTLEVHIHLHFMPATNQFDFTHREVWFTPTGKSWTKTGLKEVRSKVSSWGAGVAIGVGGTLGIGIELEVGGELDFSHEGEDFTPPSGHPTPKVGGLRKDPPDPDVSLDDHAMRPGWKMPLAAMLSDRDSVALTHAEAASARDVTVDALADLDIDDIALAITDGSYPGLARFLIARGQPTPEEVDAVTKHDDLLEEGWHVVEEGPQA
jgi:hypothetical protein